MLGIGSVSQKQSGCIYTQKLWAENSRRKMKRNENTEYIMRLPCKYSDA